MSVSMQDQLYGKGQGSGVFLLLILLLTSCVILGNLPILCFFICTVGATTHTRKAR